MLLLLSLDRDKGSRRGLCRQTQSSLRTPRRSSGGSYLLWCSKAATIPPARHTPGGKATSNKVTGEKRALGEIANYETATDTAERLGITRDRVLRLCRAGHMPGATKAGGGKTAWWLVPKDSWPDRAHFGPSGSWEATRHPETWEFPDSPSV